MARLFGQHETKGNPDQLRAVQQLVARLDEPGRRDFLAFTLRQRQPYLHRLLSAAARHTQSAHVEGYDSVLSSLAKESEGRGHEDEELCHRAAETAQRFLLLGGLGSEIEFRAVEGAAMAAAITAEDIVAYKGTAVTEEAAFDASSRALLVMLNAHVVEEQASRGLGLPAALSKAKAAVEKGCDEQLGWLKWSGA